MKTESQMTRCICRDLESLGAITFAVVGQARMQSGWPDRYVSHRLWTGWLEFKTNGNWLSAIQAKRIEEINKRKPGSAYCVFHDGRVFNHDKRLVAEFSDAAGLLLALHRLVVNMTEVDVSTTYALLKQKAKTPWQVI